MRKRARKKANTQIPLLLQQSPILSYSFFIISLLHPFFIFSLFNNINCYNNYFSYPNEHIKFSILDINEKEKK